MLSHTRVRACRDSISGLFSLPPVLLVLSASPAAVQAVDSLAEAVTSGRAPLHTEGVGWSFGLLRAVCSEVAKPVQPAVGGAAVTELMVQLLATALKLATAVLRRSEQSPDAAEGCWLLALRCAAGLARLRLPPAQRPPLVHFVQAVCVFTAAGGDSVTLLSPPQTGKEAVKKW